MIDVKKVLGKIINNDYSTSEIKTGKKWIDGKPIYRKCFDNLTGVNLNVSLPNVDRVIHFELFDKRANQCIFPSYSDNGRITPFADWYNGNIRMLQNDGTFSSSSGYCIIEYTKTTDHVGGGVAHRILSFLKGGERHG